MKKPTKSTIKPVVWLLLSSLIIVINSCSPKIQAGGLRAPANMKIDGLTQEWPGNKLQASNSSVRLEYTVCNDDDNLYLIVRSNGHNAVDKMLDEGLTFIIDHVTGKDTTNASVTFPVIPAKESNDIITKVQNYDRQRYRIDSARLKRAQLDSLLIIINKKTVEASKQININGAGGLTDSLVLITNAKGVKAAGLFDRKMAYTCELAIPLKLLTLSVKKSDKFSYTIKFGGILRTANRDSNGIITYEII